MGCHVRATLLRTATATHGSCLVGRAACVWDGEEANRVGIAASSAVTTAMTGNPRNTHRPPPAPLPRVRHRHPPPAAADSKIERADGTHRPQAFPKQDVVVLLPLSLAGKAMTSPAQRGEARPQSLRGISKG